MKAFLVRDADAEPSVRTVMKYCADHLESHMAPKHVEFIEALPRTPNGKVDKRALRAQGRAAS